MGPRIFSRNLDPGVRRVYRGVAVFFVLVFCSMIWPVVSLFSHVQPMVLGLPFFLFYLIVLLLGSFLVLLWLFLWEGRTGTSADPLEDPS